MLLNNFFGIKLQFHGICGVRHGSSVQWYLEDLMQKHKVLIFSKTYCQYSARLKELIGKYNIKDKTVVELDLEPDMHLMQVSFMLSKRHYYKF